MVNRQSVSSWTFHRVKKKPRTRWTKLPNSHTALTVLVVTRSRHGMMCDIDNKVDSGKSAGTFTSQEAHTKLFFQDRTSDVELVGRAEPSHVHIVGFQQKQKEIQRSRRRAHTRKKRQPEVDRHFVVVD